MDQPNYRVLLDGRALGPYDRKTVVGMRIKHMLTGDHQLIASDGTRLTLRELVAGAAASRGRGLPGGPGSRALASFTAILMHAGRGEFPVAQFKGELEVRVQTGRLRLEGRRRRGLRWQKDRVNIALADVAHARAHGPRVELWLRRSAADKLQRMELHMVTAEAADELLGCLPAAATDPGEPAAALVRATALRSPVSGARTLAVAILGISVVIALVLLVLLSRRSF